MIEAILGSNNRLEITAKDNAPVRINRSEWEQVLLNLSGNARDAMPGGGTLRIHVACPDQEHVVVDVEDTGQGITQEVLDSLFEPFFTTKGDQGTGLGLAVVHRIVHAAAGTIEVESTPGEGTRFHIRFPVTLGEDQKSTQAPAGAEIRI